MIYLITGLSILLFAVSLRITGIVKIANATIAAAAQSFSELSRPGLSDDDRERIARGGAMHLFSRFFSLVLRFLASLVLPTVLVAVFVALGSFGSDDVLKVLISWPFIVLGTIVCIVPFVRWKQ